MSEPLHRLPSPNNQQRIFSNLDGKKKGIRASDSRWDWFGPSIKYRGEDNKDHYLNRASAKKFLKANKIDTKKLKDDDIIAEIDKIKSSIILKNQLSESSFSPLVPSLLEDAEKEDPNALFQLGNIYFNGTKGEKRDLELAFGYYKKSADKGNLSAILCIAENYEKGYGTKIDLNEALTYYQRAAEKGDTKAAEKVVELRSKL